jgi:hypothetical protein
VGLMLDAPHIGFAYVPSHPTVEVVQIANDKEIQQEKVGLGAVNLHLVSGF